MKKNLIIITLIFYLLSITSTIIHAQSAVVTGTFNCQWNTGTPGSCSVDLNNINCVSTEEGGYVPDWSACNGVIPSACQTHDRLCIVDPTGVITPPPVPPPYIQPPNYPTTIEKFSENVDFFNVEGIKLKENLWTLNGIISTFLPYILSFAGVILLFMLISGGFTMLTAVSNPEQADAGKQRISAALLGFILLFISYWIIQILEIILGINILGS